MAQLHNGCRFQKIRILKDQEIGRGAYGMVCKAQCDGLLYAAKLLHTMVACDWTIQSFHQECKILSSLAHPNIIQYLGTHNEGPGNPVLLMELMDSSLTSFLEGSLYPSSLSLSLPPFPFRTEVNLCHDISLALAYLHCNDIIHRDLSSNNVLLTKDKRAKVTDFGMSKLMGTDRHMSRLTQVPGCAVYMPPEALMDKPVYTNKLDSFSYGVLAIQILARKFPAPGPPRRRISDPKYGPIPIEVRILEPERRKSHIDLVDPAHPILKVALACLSYEEKDRPSSGELCSQVGEMKESSQYAEGVRHEAEGGAKVELQGQRDLELSQLREQLQRLEEEKKILKECVEELTSQLKSANEDKSNGGITDSDNHSPGKKDKKYAEQRGLQKELMEAYRKRSELADKVYEIAAMMNEKDGELNKKDKAIHELQATISALRAESESYQQKYQLEAAVSKSVQDELRNLQMLYIKERDKNDDLRRIIEKQNHELKEMKESKDKIKSLNMSRPPLQPDATVVRQLSTTSLESSTMDSLALDRHYSLGTTGSAATSSGPQDPTQSLKKSMSPMSKKMAICPSSNVHQFVSFN